MKILKNLILLFPLFLFSCSTGDDPGPEPLPEPSNQAPQTFRLHGIADNPTDISLGPTFSWDAAVDPDGDEVRYDLYLGTEISELSLVASNLQKTDYEMEERLLHVTTYTWKVVAKDPRGGETHSPGEQFKTRNIRLSEVIDNSGLEPIAHAEAAIFNEKIWVTGGWPHEPQEAQFRNDVFYSEDGSTWSRANDLPLPAVGHELLVFDNRLWNIGGDDGSPIGIQNHVMFSEDGSSWNFRNLDESLPVLTEHSALEWDGELLVIGGYDDIDTKNKIWKSGDGNNWQVIAEDLNFLGYNSEAILFKNKLWIIPGFREPSENLFYSSSDGVSWEAEESNHPLPYYLYRSLVVYNNKIWAIGGDDLTSNNDGFEIWYSDDAVNWFKADFEGIDHLLYRHASVVFNDKIYIIGGATKIPNDLLSNRIWVLE